MSTILTIAQRELRSFFVSPLAWAILTFFLFVQGIVFALIVGYLSDPRAPQGMTPFEIFFNSYFLWISLMFVTPVITMRLLSEERRSGTIEALMTSPVTETQVVVAKFLAAFVFWCFLWLPTVLYPIIVARNTEVDWGPVAAGYVGIAGLGAMFLSVGLLGSSFSKNQIVAAVASFGLLMTFLILPWFENMIPDDRLEGALGYSNLSDHMGVMTKGIVDSRYLVFYLSTTVLFLFLTSRTLEAKKWR